MIVPTDSYSFRKCPKDIVSPNDDPIYHHTTARSLSNHWQPRLRSLGEHSMFHETYVINDAPSEVKQDLHKEKTGFVSEAYQLFGDAFKTKKNCSDQSQSSKSHYDEPQVKHTYPSLNDRSVSAWDKIDTTFAFSSTDDTSTDEDLNGTDKSYDHPVSLVPSQKRCSSAKQMQQHSSALSTFSNVVFEIPVQSTSRQLLARCFTKGIPIRRQFISKYCTMGCSINNTRNTDLNSQICLYCHQPSLPFWNNIIAYQTHSTPQFVSPSTTIYYQSMIQNNT